MNDPADSSLVETSATERFVAAKEIFVAQLKHDFPDFSVTQYADEKATKEGVDKETLSSKIWTQVRSVPTRLDLTGDGKIDLNDARLAAQQASAGLGKAWTRVSSINKDDIKSTASAAARRASETGKKVFDFDYLDTARRAGQKVTESARTIDNDTFKSSGKTLLKLGKTATGIRGIQSRNQARSIRQVSEAYVNAAEAVTDERRAALFKDIQDFGDLRLAALHDTLGRFLTILEDLKQQNSAKEYELLDAIGIDTETLNSLGALDMSVAHGIKTTVVAGALGLTAMFSTPTLVTASVGALATASTGTAISGLSGAAYNNAVLAWLGGGSLAAHGGGMAAGSAVLAGITVGATAGVTLLASGILISTHYTQKLTEAKTYQKDVALAVANLENAWLVMDGISSRVDELSAVTSDLKERIDPLLTKLESLVPNFDSVNSNDVAIFNQCGLLVKTMVELAQVPLLGEDGELTEQSLSITVHVKKVLNTEV